ncbi:MAG: mechanosensitive ion channel [Treponema sp.]|jgi:small conductance mechanosensitive channel|nr:mechanosensitive ion channel [Treponema sp.]
MDLREVLFEFWNKWDGGVLAAGVFTAGKRVLTSALIILAGRVLISAAGRIVKRLTSGRLQIDETVGSILKPILTYMVIVVCVIMILDVFGINTTSLIAILGAAGVAVGLALKDTLGNIASGIILVLLRLYRKGDFIECGSVTGTVRNMDLFITTLETPDGVYVSAPNSSIWGTPLKNYSRNVKRRMELAARISFDDSIDKAFQVMRDIIAEESRFLADPAPQIVVQSLGDSSITVVLRAWAPLDVYWDIYWAQMKSIKERMEAAGLRIPYPRQELAVTGDFSSRPPSA